MAWRGEVGSVDLRTADESLLGEIHAFEELMDAEADPEGPTRSAEEYIAAVRSIPGFIDVTALFVRDTLGALAGEAECVLVRTSDNPHLAQLSVSVRGDMRGLGIGRRLLAEAADLAEADRRSLFVGVTSDRVPTGEAFARRIGAREVNASHESCLRLADVDVRLIDAWITDGPVRASGYSVVSVDGPLPEAMVEEVASLLDVMNDAPGGDSDLADRHTTAAELREWDAQAEATGSVRWWLFARHDATGALVGLTDVSWNPPRPKTVHQGSTGVRGEHRGHALGKWLKASMLKRIMQDCPEAIDVRTNNADSNDAMVGINRSLGFEHHIAVTTWHADLAAIRAYLRS